LASTNIDSTNTLILAHLLKPLSTHIPTSYFFIARSDKVQSSRDAEAVSRSDRIAKFPRPN